MMKHYNLRQFKNIISQTDPYLRGGKVTQVIGLTVETVGVSANIGELCKIFVGKHGEYVLAEVVGFKDDNVLLMPFGELSGIGLNNYVVPTNDTLKVPVGLGLCGRVLDAMGQPMDSKGPIDTETYYPIDCAPPNPLDRTRIKEPLNLGVKAIDLLLTIGKGQRIGIFAGSGVGKSTLLGMITRNSSADINVIVLVGERGREVREFLEKDLGKEGLKNSVLVIATSDQPAIMRLKSAMVGTSIAEYFRDIGYNVLLMMDSLTRFAMAQRDIGMAIGEPPISRGFTPSVYSVMPKLLERSGTSHKGSITGVYTVLVEGDDMNEPISDTVRGILDGHIVLSRNLAHNNHYPAIDVLGSVSRVMPDIASQEHIHYAEQIRKYMAAYRDAQDLISIGAYKKGTSEEIDKAIELIGPINELLKQKTNLKMSANQMFEAMKNIFE